MAVPAKTNLIRVVRSYSLTQNTVTDLILASDIPGKTCNFTNYYDEQLNATVTVNQSFNQITIINQDAVKNVYLNLMNDPHDHYTLLAANQDAIVEIGPNDAHTEVVFFKRVRLMLLAASSANVQVILSMNPSQGM